MSEDEMVFDYNESGEFVPVELEDGMYEAVLRRIEQIDTQYGKSLRWVFGIETEDGEAEISGITSAKFSSKSKAFKWFTALGGQVKNGRVYIRDVIDSECLVEVKNRKGSDGETEFPNVVDVKPPMRKRVKKTEEPEEEEKTEEEEEEVEEEEIDMTKETPKKTVKKTKKSKKTKSMRSRQL